MEDLTARKLVTTSKITPTIHPMFPVSKSALIDQSIENVENCMILPEPSDLNSNMAVEFIIHDSPGHYLNLSSLELEIEIALVKPQGAYLAAERAYFIDNLLSTAFPIRKVSLAGTNVETQYAGSYIGHMKHLLEANNESSIKVGKPRGLFKIEPSRYRSPINIDTCNANADRMTWSKNRDHVIMRGYLDLDVCSLNKWILDLVPVKITLESAPNPFLINSDDNATAFKKQIKSIKLYVDKILPSPGGFLSVSKAVMRDPMEYILTRHLTYNEILAAGQSSITLNRPWQSRIPQKIYLFMVKQNADVGMYNESPLYFHHNDLINYRVMIDGNPLLDVTCNSADGYVGPYVISQKSYDEGDSFLPFDMYAHGGFILVIKTNHSQKHELSFESKGNLSIILKFRNNVVENYIVYLIGQQHSSLSITGDRSCITNYTY